MSKLITLALSAMLLMGIVGCSVTQIEVSPVTPTEPSGNVTTPVETLPASLTNPTSDPNVEARLVDQTWISPAMVQIGNYYPGARAEWSIRVHNGKDVPAGLLISYRVPDNVKEGYDTAPVEAKDWVIIADSTPVLAAKETKEILVVLAMPKDPILVPEVKKWEFWVSVMETKQGQVQTEMCSRWLVVMR